jgi:hypothetical protein
MPLLLQSYSAFTLHEDIDNQISLPVLAISLIFVTSRLLHLTLLATFSLQFLSQQASHLQKSGCEQAEDYWMVWVLSGSYVTMLDSSNWLDY